MPHAAWVAGGVAGLLAGVGALVLPPRLGLGHPPGGHRATTRAMTVGWCLADGLASAGACLAWAVDPARFRSTQ